MQKINQILSPAFTYPVVFTRGLFKQERGAFLNTFPRRDDRSPSRFIAILDNGVAESHPTLAQDLADCVKASGGSLNMVCDPVVLPGGEAAKNDYRRTMGMVDLLLEHRLCRQSYVVAVGGGALLDAVGFAVSIVHRGLRLIRCPSTVLAQNDAGIGVKNGMNLHGGKNTIGTFHPPFAVLNDLDLLDTLSDQDWSGGLSEAFKVAMIRDADFFHWLCAHAEAFSRRDRAAMEQQVIRCAELHLDHMRDSGDPFELGTARPLDFGHWSAHKLESMSNYRIGHGQAVAVGVALDALYAARTGFLPGTEADRLVDALHAAGLPTWYPECGRRLGDGQLEILQGIEDFREHLGGQLCVTLPDGVGGRCEVHELDCSLVADCLHELERRQPAPDRIPGTGS